ncbi:uncharacterized protein CCOS01_16029 [Colletotrichum costaricense]|uniref:Uncharacterized protein n=1 Tax=Colletotrichum costaricense TaxID=1209916 RepID=A0AAI9YG51_9PEZI|nr:uncharacterized protein CCOS01_16029 [Colletotrichum costaricense]KAK1508028.1 hypothetical protein CCOS01_16029 [Colletotrichum costaricense]
MANDKKVEREWRIADDPGHTVFQGLKGPNTGASLLSTTAQRPLLKHELILGYENEDVPAGKTYHGLPLDSERAVRKSGGTVYNGIRHVPIWGGKASPAHDNRPRFASRTGIKSMVMSGIRLLITYSHPSYHSSRACLVLVGTSEAQSAKCRRVGLR